MRKQRPRNYYFDILFACLLTNIFKYILTNVLDMRLMKLH